MSVAKKLIESHLVDGVMTPGEEIALTIDHTLTQDATGTLVMLELEAMDLDTVKTEVSAQYVDHNLIQEDYKNADDHLFLLSACRRFGIWYSKAGNGISHVVHQERFGAPGLSMLGSDSHTPAAGSLGMLAIGAGGLEVALAMAGEPLHVKMPEIWGVKLTGELPDWVSAKDVVLEMLRRHGVRGGRGKILEFFGPGLNHLSAMDRHVIANMGTELGATTTVFPADEEVKRFLEGQGRGPSYRELQPHPETVYDYEEELDLSSLEPLIAMPSSPGNVRRVRDVQGTDIYQAYVGSSANPGYRDFAAAAHIVRGQQTAPGVSFDVNPTSRQVLATLARENDLLKLIQAGARVHQTGCNGCIGMGQAPATQKISLRTVPRNFPGRSGTREDKVCLVSPETAAASALIGRITDPRDLHAQPPRIREPADPPLASDMLVEPPSPREGKKVELNKGPNIGAIPELCPVPDKVLLPVLLKVADDISTDEILPAGARVLPYRSNIAKISEFAFEAVDPRYVERTEAAIGHQPHVIVAGYNYGQGSSREHAALAPRYLGLTAVIAKSFARIHWQNLINFGILPLTFEDPGDYDTLESHDELAIDGLHKALHAHSVLPLKIHGKDRTLHCRHELSARQVDVILKGGLINHQKERLQQGDEGAGQQATERSRQTKDLRSDQAGDTLP